MHAGEVVRCVGWDRNKLLFTYAAARRGYIEICKLILKHVTDKNPRNYFGDTPFSLAKESGHDEICKMITESSTQKEGP